MSGLDAHVGGAGPDLLKRATQALMMSNKAAVTSADEDGGDHLGFETPRSGVATPQPDLHDRRLPSILTNFGQVGASSPISELSDPTPFVRVSSTALGLEGSIDPEKLPRKDLNQETEPKNVKSGQRSWSLANGEWRDFQRTLLAADYVGQAEPSSRLDGSNNEGKIEAAAKKMGNTSPSGPRLSFLPKVAPNVSSMSTAPSTSVVTASHATSAHICVPETSTTISLRPPHSRAASETVKPRQGWFGGLGGGIKLLTKAFKSGPSTPTRALSQAQPSQAVDNNGAEKANENGASISRSQTPRPTAAGAAPATRGKLTIKIVEARGLRKCRDPYVVAVFQRSELISAGPRAEDDDEEPKSLPVHNLMGGVPIQRSGSDSGRTPMAIPMRSRQSSNTSVTDYNAFRNKGARKPYTDPKWDAEAIFDVVDSDTLVDISIYGYGLTGEELLGHVDLRANIDSDKPVSGWFALRGHADTMAENTPTGELHVEASFQRAEKRHFGPEDFQILKLIGKGTFGQVYQVRKKDTQRIYAMKVLSKKVIVQKKEVVHTLGERNILVRTAMSDSPFIVSLKFSFQTPSDLYLVTDYMSGGELFWHLQKEGRFDERRAKFYISELILAIQHLHKNDIVYRDLKPENILLDANGHIALCDFGLSKANLTKNDTTNTFCGTTEYLAPEVLLDESGYTKMVDFWSLGVLVFEMCCGWSPFYADDTQQMYKNIAFGKVKFPQRALSTEGKNFVKGLLNRNPRHRLGAQDDAEELMRHAFFADTDWDLLTKKLITPPFKPKLKNETDVSYFDPEFTNALNNSESLHDRAEALSRGFATSTPLSPSVQANFQGFTYVDESALEEHMRDRYNDQDMHDAPHAGGSSKQDDDDWDNLDDIDMRRANRMSGIVRNNNTDEHMMGQFDP